MDQTAPAPDGRRLVPVNDVVLCADSFGDATDPSLLLIGGTSNPMDAWHPHFCAMLAAGGRHVIRYDNRDTGESTSCPAGRPTYGFDDLVRDAVGLLDALGAEPVHLAGVSMGGAVARAIALQQPERVRSLTLFSSTPRGPGDPQDPSLPPPTAAFIESASARRPPPDWADRESYVDNYVLWDRACSGSRYFDEAQSREYAGHVFDRTRDLHAASVNHGAADPGSTPIRSRHAEIRCPVLVLHGTEAPILPFEHAEVLTRELPRARLVALPGVGHQ